MPGGILVARDSSLVTFEGREVYIIAGTTTVREGHPILDSYGEMFVPLVPSYEVEAQSAPTPPAPKPEPPKPAAKDPAAKDPAGS